MPTTDGYSLFVAQDVAVEDRERRSSHSTGYAGLRSRGPPLAGSTASFSFYRLVLLWSTAPVAVGRCRRSSNSRSTVQTSHHGGNRSNS